MILFFKAMAEEVNTGGTKIFRYSKSDSPKLRDEEKREIREAYARADERRRRESTRNWIIGILIALVILGILIYFLLK